jgi:hypothetical protein
VSEGGTAAGATVFNCQIFPFSKKFGLSASATIATSVY